jgi:hypothetical protein
MNDISFFIPFFHFQTVVDCLSTYGALACAAAGASIGVASGRGIATGFFLGVAGGTVAGGIINML